MHSKEVIPRYFPTQNISHWHVHAVDANLNYFCSQLSRIESLAQNMSKWSMQSKGVIRRDFRSQYISHWHVYLLVSSWVIFSAQKHLKLNSFAQNISEWSMQVSFQDIFPNKIARNISEGSKYSKGVIPKYFLTQSVSHWRIHSLAVELSYFPSHNISNLTILLEISQDEEGIQKASIQFS